MATLTNVTLLSEVPALATLDQDTALVPPPADISTALRLLQDRRAVLYERRRLAAFVDPAPADEVRVLQLAAELFGCLLRDVQPAVAANSVLRPPTLGTPPLPAETGLEPAALTAVADLTGRLDDSLQPAVGRLNLKHVTAFFYWRQDALQDGAGPDGFPDDGVPRASAAWASPYPGFAAYRMLCAASVRQLARNILDADEDTQSTPPRATARDLFRSDVEVEANMFVRVLHQPRWLVYTGAAIVNDGNGQTFTAPGHLREQLKLVRPFDFIHLRTDSAENATNQRTYRVGAVNVQGQLISVTGKNPVPVSLPSLWVVIVPSLRSQIFYYPLALAPMTRVQDPADVTLTSYEAGPWPVRLTVTAACRAPDGTYSVAPQQYAWDRHPSGGQPLADAAGSVSGRGTAELTLTSAFFPAGPGVYSFVCAITPPTTGCDARVTEASATRAVRVTIRSPGAEAPLSEAGYQSVANTGNAEMAAFVRRVASSLGLRITSESDLAGLVPYYSGQIAVQTYGALVQEVQQKTWIQPA
jgi:hypothetical protein